MALSGINGRRGPWGVVFLFFVFRFLFFFLGGGGGVWGGGGPPPGGSTLIEAEGEGRDTESVEGKQRRGIIFEM